MGGLAARQSTASFWVALMVLVAGLALIWLATPRTIAYAKLAAGNQVLTALSRGEQVSPKEFAVAIAGRRGALAWIDLPDAWTSIGSLYLALARRDGLSPGDRNALLERGIKAFERGLSVAPSRPFAWAQLAQAHLLLDFRSDKVEPLLHMSLKTGPREPRLISQRVRIGFAARELLSPDIASHIREDVRLWARHDPWRLADWARPQFALPWVRQALKDQPALTRAFLINYLRLPPR